MRDIKYKTIVEGVFIERPNRFIAKVIIDGKECTVHVKNTGRCKELLIEGSRVFLSYSDNPQRKTQFDLVAVEKVTDNGVALINIDSQLPNVVAYEWLKSCGLFSENAIIRPETKYNNSRFDFYIQDGNRKIYLEVKGVTLENDGVAMFPDAPTDRGVKHIKELITAVKEGYETFILFVIQMKNIDYFTPNYKTHPEFGEALKIAEKSGVKVLAFDSIVTYDSVVLDKEIKVVL